MSPARRWGNGGRAALHTHPEEPSSFSDPSREWRRIFSEAYGTFFLVIVAAGAKLLHTLTHGAVGDAAAVVAPGLMVMVAIYTVGAVGGAHINPAVTLAFALRRNFPWSRVPGYLVAQMAGALGASGMLLLLFGAKGDLGATKVGVGIPAWVALAVECVLTTGLITTILATATGAQNVGPNGAIAVGGYVALAGLWAGPVSGASMNPARSLGPDIVRGHFGETMIYVIGPLAGALLAVGIEWILKGPPTKQGNKTAQGEGA